VRHSGSFHRHAMKGQVSWAQKISYLVHDSDTKKKIIIIRKTAVIPWLVAVYTARRNQLHFYLTHFKNRIDFTSFQNQSVQYRTFSLWIVTILITQRTTHYQQQLSPVRVAGKRPSRRKHGLWKLYITKIINSNTFYNSLHTRSANCPKQVIGNQELPPPLFP